MAVIDPGENQITLKIVYCGPPQSGKTANLSHLHNLVDEAHRGRLLSLEGGEGPSRFVDLLPIFFRVADLRVCLKVYTVPGQPEHQMTRRAVLCGVDGIVFVANSEPGHAHYNAWAFGEVQENLRMIGLDPEETPLTTQYNKRDLGSEGKAKPFAGERVVLADALGGLGVRETFMALAERAWRLAEQDSEIDAFLSVSTEEFMAALSSHLRL